MSEKSREEDNYDLRIAAVNSGSYPINWVVEMMFCSELGVGFPDVDGSVCRMVQDYRSNNIDDNQYYELFEKSIFENASIVPVLHMSLKWNFSKKIDPSSIDPTSSVIRFDLIRNAK